MVLNLFVRRELVALRLVLIVLLIGTGNVPVSRADTAPPVAVTLASPTSPSVAQPGVTSVNVTGSGFPSGTISASGVSVTLAPATIGPAESTKVTAATLITGSTWRVTFQVTGSNVASPTLYKVSLSGTTSTGTSFASANTASLTINPPAAISLLKPALGGSGQSLAVQITGQYTNYVNGATRANFGAGISVGGAAQGTYGPVTVTGPTSATANLVISPSATPGPRNVTVATGLQQALLANGFTVINQPPQVNAGTNQTITQSWQLFVADATNHDVQGYDGITAASLGTFVAPNSGGLSGAESVSLGSDGRFYVADGTANKIFRYNGETGSFLDAFVDLNPQTATFKSMTFGRDGNLYVGDSAGEQVLQYSGTTGAFVKAFVTPGSGGLSGPAGLAFGPDGNLYVSSAATGSVLQFNGSTGAFMSTFASGNGLSSPGSLAFAADGSLFVASASSVLHFEAGNGTFLGVAASGNGLTNPGQIQFGPDGNLYVANLGANNNILRFNGVTGAFISIFVPAGTDGLATPSGFTFALESQTQLAASVSDDGFPIGGTLTQTWSEVSGPGTAIFSNPNAVSPKAFFDNPGGIYDLRLTANDGQLSNSADVMVTVNPVADHAPLVSAGPNQTITLPVNSVTLDGSATDDGLPLGGLFTTTWSMVSGPAAVTFGNSNAAVTTASFTTAGVYDLRLTANDSLLSNTSDVRVTVNPAATPVLTLVSPNTGQQGQQNETVNLTGQFTNWVQGTTTASFGPGITVANLTINSATTATAKLNIDPAAATGARNVTMTTGVELATATNGFTVTAAATITIAVSPGTGQQGQQNLNVTITGTGTHFVQGTTTANFGANVSVGGAASGTSGPVIVGSPTSATAVISVDNVAAIGSRNVSVQTGAEQATLSNGFSVTAGTPVLLSASPKSELQGATNQLVNLTGMFTHWAQGVSVANFGAGITVNSLTVSSSTTATASITVSGSATVGLRNVIVTTTPEQVTLANGFGVTQSAAAPTLAITSPADASTINTATDVIGTISSTILQSWTLGVQFPNENSLRIVATGTNTVSAAKIATLDPTLLPNGVARLTLSATDLNQVTVSTFITVSFTGNQKVGKFTVSFVDMRLDQPGFPLEIVRTYDSRNASSGDFGAGWTLSLKSVNLADNRPIGDTNTWQVTGSFLSFCYQELNPHRVTVTMADGTVLVYAAVAQDSSTNACGANFLGGTGTVVFQQLSGPTATLVPTNPGPLGGLDFFVTDGSTLFDSNDILTVLDLASTPGTTFTLTFTDGRQFIIDPSTGLKSATDPNGNTVMIGPGGITSSPAGRSALFTRDLQNRITQITDPNGKSLLYAYDSNGDLVGFADRAGSTTTYVYNATHGLLQINAPNGQQPIKNVYDDSGRLIQQIDPLGHVVNFTPNLSAKEEVITDRLGNATVYDYDADGNVTQETDALGEVTKRTFGTFNGVDLVTSETDALNNTRSFTYDANGNKLTETDALGKVTTNTYDGNGRLLTRTDPRGNVVTNTYDPNGNLLTTTDQGGGVTTFTLNSTGLRTSKKDALGNLTTYTYDSAGDMLTETNPMFTTTYTYDANGNRLSKSITRHISGAGTEVDTVQYQYDANGRRIKVIYPDGSSTQTVYDGLGRVIDSVDQFGGHTTTQYDVLGNVSQTNYPDGTLIQATYDAESHKVSTTDQAGRVTHFQYDAVGRLTQTAYPDSATVSNTYDKAGRLTNVTDALGHVTTNSYDANGRLVSVTDAASHTSTFTYDASGNRISLTDANGHVTQYQYDPLKHRTKTTYQDGTFQSTAYDVLGRITSKTDQAGHITQFAYDALNHLIQVTDALGHITLYTYDEAGNRTTQTDANGHTTTFAYDSMGRMIKRTLPGGQFETFTYDAAGNQSSHTDFNGKTTTMTYDSMNRRLTITPDASFGAAQIQFTYNATGKRASMTDASGLTTYAYDTRDKLLSKATPEGTLTYTYDLDGRLLTIHSSNAGGASVTYAYDNVGRLITATDNNLPGSTSYNYDNVGNLTGTTYPNGVGTTYAYDTLNRLTSETVGNGGIIASYLYTLGATGNRTNVAELGGRTVTYSYDATFKLTGETISGDPANNGTIGYTYDPAGNRTNRSSTSAGVPSATYTYDVNDRLTSDTYDANGNTTASGANTYTYDFNNQLHGVTPAGATYVYDGDGRRVKKTNGLGTTSYLIDDRNPTGLPQVLEEISGGTVQRVYVYGTSRISMHQASGTRFYVYDGRGSVRLLTDATGAITDTYTYDAFGIKIGSTGTTPNDFLFSGEQFDANAQFYYMRARYMNQATGRFTTMDPFPGIITDPPSLHRYTYAGNDPVNKTDPTGRQFDVVSISISFSIDSTIEAAYTQELVKTFFDVVQIAYCCLEPATYLQGLALDAIAGDAPDYAFDMYELATDMVAKGYQMIAIRIAQTYRNIVADLFHVEFDFKIPLIGYEIKKKADLADILGIPDLSGKLKDLEKAFEDFTGEWKDQLNQAGITGHCDVAKLLNKVGEKLADKLGEALNESEE